MRRRSEEGVALLEVLIAIILVAMFLSGALVYQSRAATDQRQRLDEFLLTEFAHGKIEEWSVGGLAATEVSGSEIGGWNWNLVESDASPLWPSSLDGLVLYKHIEIEVWHDQRPAFRVFSSAIVARRHQ